MKSLRIETAALAHFDLKTRMPFKYGIATMTELPHVMLRIQFRTDKGIGVGYASDHLPPKWFKKDPNQSPDDEIDEMLGVIKQAINYAKIVEAGSIFQFWISLYRQMEKWALDHSVPPLLAHFGTSLVERAVIQAFCNVNKITLITAIKENLLGIRLSEMDPSMPQINPSFYLPKKPLDTFILRHTVGLADPLDDSELTATKKVDDGLPESLEATIQEYGLIHFKIKVTGHLDQDENRLEKIFRVIERSNPAKEWKFSLDGNENFATGDEFRRYWNELIRLPFFSRNLKRLLFIEQPLNRDTALTEDANWLNWNDGPPILIDESDGRLEDLPLAIGLGYSGTSHKNCKGIFRGILNRCRISVSNEKNTRRIFTSAEDLANIAPIALNQDLLIQAILGNHSVERNGHHYFAGLSIWPKPLQSALIHDHPDLFEPGDKNTPARLRIRNGTLSITSLQETSFGLGQSVQTHIDQLIDSNTTP